MHAIFVNSLIKLHFFMFEGATRDQIQSPSPATDNLHLPSVPFLSFGRGLPHLPDRDIF